MGNNKNQHYVPQSYFRLFSKDNMHIESYILAREECFTSNIRHLCSENYFYSKNTEIEQALSNLENSQIKIIKNIISSKTIPCNPKDCVILVSFLCMQHFRTKAAKHMMDESMDLLSDELIEGTLGKKTDMKIKFPTIQQYNIKIILQFLPLLFDLAPLIIINKTFKNFIFSDNPVVFHNMYFRKTGFGTTGIGSSGLQIFCPLDDNTMIMLYDPKYYSVNDMMDNYCLEIHNDNDLKHLNELQFLNCNKTIFYSDKSKGSEIKFIHDKIKHLISKKTFKKENIKIPNNQKKIQMEFLHVYSEQPDYNLNLSFIKLNKVSNIGILRNSSLEEKIKNDIDKYDRAYQSKLYGYFYKIETTFKRLRFRIKEKIRKR